MHVLYLLYLQWTLSYGSTYTCRYRVYKPMSQGPRFGYRSLARTCFPSGWGKEHFHRILLTLCKDFQKPYIWTTAILVMCSCLHKEKRNSKCHTKRLHFSINIHVNASTKCAKMRWASLGRLLKLSSKAYPAIKFRNYKTSSRTVFISLYFILSRFLWVLAFVCK